MSKKFPEHNYKGFVAAFEDETEYDSDGCPENVKIYHWVKPPDGGKEIIMDWSPYSVPSFEEFKLWIDLDCPDRFDKGLGERTAFFPIDGKDLRIIYNYRFSTPESRR